MAKIKVLIVDDSALVRRALADIIESDSGLELIGTAPDPIFAMEKMAKQWPDVILLDVEMPRMDGISFLKKIMHERPTPVIICSTLTTQGAHTSIDAMEAGAIEIVTKPKLGTKDFFTESRDNIVNAVKSASRVNIGRAKKISSMLKASPVVNERDASPKLTADAVLAQGSTTAMKETTDKVVAIGTSAGGTQALEYILTSLPRVCPGIAIVQHMPEKFTTAFANRLNSLSKIEVKEGENGDRLRPGLAIIAPGNKHMLLKRSGAQYYVEVVDGPLVSRHRPSVDVLFRSVAKYSGKNALGIIMTGMGDDGANGMLEMKQAGVTTIAQDEETCVVFGMPAEAIKKGGVDRVLPLQLIGKEIMAYYNSTR